ncbi:MAG: ATP synthase F1 subunit epsilon [Phycisphaerae bacterium]
MPDEKPFKCEVLTPAGRVTSASAVSVIMPLVDGMMGVLADHAPLIAKMGAGPLTIRQADNVVHRYFVAGGFASIRDNSLSILAEECQSVEKLNPAAAGEELSKAQALPAQTPAERQRRREAVAVASARLRVAHGRA